MAVQTSRGGPLQSLTVGNVVSVGLQLYRLRLNDSFLVSLLAHLWLFLITFGVVILLGLAVFLGATSRDLTVTATIIAIATIVVLPPLAFGFARFLAAGGLLARLMFSKLRDQELKVAEIRPEVYRRTWAYLRATWWVGLILFAIYLGLALLGFVLFVGFVPLFDAITSADLAPELTTTIAIAGVILGLLILLAFLLVIYYVAGRLILIDVVLAMEEQVTPWQSVRRSWELTRGHGWRTLAVLFIATVMMIPATSLAFTINLFVPLVNLVFNVAVFPFWASIKAVLYYDLRSRNEGLNFDVQTATPHPHRFLRHVILQTPESVELEFTLGGLGSRTYAWIIDVVLIGVGLALLFFIGGYIYFFALLPALSSGLDLDVDTLNLWALAIAVLVYFLITNGYFIAFETRWQGQTPGKRLAQIRVVQDNGRPIGLREATLRSLVGFIDLNLFFIGPLLMAFTRSEKRLGDMAAGTLVIQDEKATTGMASLLDRQQEQPAASPVVTVAEATKEAAQTLLSEGNIRSLSPDQYITIRDFLKTRQQLDAKPRQETAARLAAQIQSLIFNDNQNFSLAVTDEEFLEAVYLAYRRSARVSRTTEMS